MVNSMESGDHSYIPRSDQPDVGLEMSTNIIAYWHKWADIINLLQIKNRNIYHLQYGPKIKNKSGEF